MKTKFWMVRRADCLFYNPNAPGNLVDPTFHKIGKRYKRLSDAIKAVEFCASEVNTTWTGRPEKKPIKTEIYEYHEIVEEIGPIDQSVPTKTTKGML